MTVQTQFEETQIDKQKVILADCFEVMKTWPDGFVDAVLTSPPFRDADLDLGQEYYSWYQKFIKECCRVSRDYVFALNSSRRIKEISRLTDYRKLMIWDKGYSRMSFRYEPIFVYSGIEPSYNIDVVVWSDCVLFQPILRFPKGYTSRGHNFDLNANNGIESFQVLDGHHPYENPVRLYHTFLRMLKKGGSQTILDPCLGSGTTLEACIRLDLKGIGIERERIYYDMAIKRLEKFRGQERLQFE